jgi:hypothetical protein
MLKNVVVQDYFLMDCDYCLIMKKIVQHIGILGYLNVLIQSRFLNNLIIVETLKRCSSASHCFTKSGAYIDIIFDATGPTTEKD